MRGGKGKDKDKGKGKITAPGTPEVYPQPATGAAPPIMPGYTGPRSHEVRPRTMSTPYLSIPILAKNTDHLTIAELSTTKDANVKLPGSFILKNQPLGLVGQLLINAKHLQNPERALKQARDILLLFSHALRNKRFENLSLKDLLGDPKIAEYVHHIAQIKGMPELTDFYAEASHFQQTYYAPETDPLTRNDKASEIVTTYIKEGAPGQINIKDGTRKAIEARGFDQTMFDAALEEVGILLQEEIGDACLFRLELAMELWASQLHLQFRDIRSMVDQAVEENPNANFTTLLSILKEMPDPRY
ncbi:hypothetical protein ACFL96_00945 [Thermoproteota archaeon]